MGGLKGILNKVAATGLLFTAVQGNLDSQNTLLDKVASSLNQDGSVKSEFYIPNEDFISYEGEDGMYLCKSYKLGSRYLITYHPIGELAFGVPNGLGLTISQKPQYYLIDGKMYIDMKRNGINGDELEMPISEAEPKDKDGLRKKTVRSA